MAEDYSDEDYDDYDMSDYSAEGEGEDGSGDGDGDGGNNPLANTLILHPGSANLYYGRGDDTPKRMASLVGWRVDTAKDPNSTLTLGEAPYVARVLDMTQDIETDTTSERFLAEDAAWDALESTLLEARKEYHRSRKKAYKALPNEPVNEYKEITPADGAAGASTDTATGGDEGVAGKGVNESESGGEGKFAWTDTSAEPPVVVGDAAQNLYPGAPYHIVQPIQRRHIARENYGVSELVIRSLEALFAAAAEECGFTREDRANTRVAVVIPDAHSRFDVHVYYDLVLRRMGFASMVAYPGSLAASMYARLHVACVVDIGAESISVGCMQDGRNVVKSRVVIHHGVRDTLSIFYRLTVEGSLPPINPPPSDSVVVRGIDELAQSTYHLNVDAPDQVTATVAFRTDERGQGRTYEVAVGDSSVRAPLTLFFPTILPPTTPPFPVYEYSDVYDDAFLSGSAVPRETDAAVHPGDWRNEQKWGLHDAILWSIDQCGRADNKKRMYSCILLAGGGSAIPGLTEELVRRLKEKLPEEADGAAEVVGPFVNEIHPSELAWRGVKVVLTVNAAQNYYVHRDQYLDPRSGGVDCIRRRCSFPW